MARVLMVGIDPDTVDYADPAFPPGMTAEMIRGGIAHGLDELRAAGHDAERLFIPADPAEIGALAERLALEPVDCVIVGGGVWLPQRNLILFEAVLNVIASAGTTIALIARPDQAAPAAARVLGRS